MLQVFKNIDWRDIGIRSVKTFVAAFLSGWALTNYSWDKGAIVGAFAAGFTAILNLGLEVWKQS